MISIGLLLMVIIGIIILGENKRYRVGWYNNPMVLSIIALIGVIVILIGGSAS